MSEELEGFRVLVRALRHHGVEYMFGVVGVPVVEVAVAAMQEGIHYVGMRNEQSACYAAQASGYLTGRPGVCLTVSGPGVLHALGGMANAKENCWPLIVVGGAADAGLEGKGAFQEWPQVESARLYTKFSTRPTSVSHIPTIVERAFRASVFGRPGATYIDMPGDLLSATISSDELVLGTKVPRPPLSVPPNTDVQRAAALLRAANRPLVIIGKGAAYARAESSVRRLVSSCNLPFLPTPMGKGVVPDGDSRSVAPARTAALLGADVVLLLGARLNWMLHFGGPPRYSSSAKFIQCDLSAEEFGNAKECSVALLGDLNLSVEALVQELGSWKLDGGGEWWSTLREKVGLNKEASRQLYSDTSVPLNFYAAFHAVRSELPNDATVVSEGANTMDIGRAFLDNSLPRHRLDAGTFGTMGVGLGFAIAAALYCRDYEPNSRVICVEGDSAFGFSGMELETIVRYKLPIVVLIMNNNGIYGGLDGDSYKEVVDGQKTTLATPPTALMPAVRYERMMRLFDLETGHLCHTVDDIQKALKTALRDKSRPHFINVAIDPFAGRKAQSFDWLTRSKM